MRESYNELLRFSAQCNAEMFRFRSTNAVVAQLLEQIDQLLAPTIIFTDDVDARIRGILEQIQMYAGGLGITKAERISITTAMGRVSGHWYKCPNGHIYYIGECGGPDQHGRCNECGAGIGGAGHVLVGQNERASEMENWTLATPAVMYVGIGSTKEAFSL